MGRGVSDHWYRTKIGATSCCHPRACPKLVGTTISSFQRKPESRGGGASHTEAAY